MIPVKVKYTNNLCPDCGSELLVAYDKEDHDVYIWCEECGYENET